MSETPEDWSLTGSAQTPRMEPQPDLANLMRRRGDEAQKFIADLDRCPHGRHSIDPCFSCPGGQSAGNPHLVEGQIIGYDYTGRPYRVPAGARGERSEWLEPRP